ncbi:MFS transporter [Nocardioides sp. GCM10027113]|uniref:MFS transporter n=1 Tax=unclassified Nocardioides TaxID=2615069 RepID=UPI003615F699
MTRDVPARVLDPGPAPGSRDVGPAGDAAALDPAALRRVVGVLALSQITSWGCLYYGFAALQASIAAGTGWSAAQVTGAWSLSQLVSAGVGVWVGRHLDVHGPRRVMTAGALLALPGMATVAAAPSLPVFYVGWVTVGAAMAGTLYAPAFAAITRWAGPHRVRALTAITLAGGLASTVFAPLAAAVDAAAGWRVAFVVLMLLAAAITLPLHWWGLRRPWPADVDVPRSRRARAAGVAVAGGGASAAFVALAAAHALTAFAAYAVVVNLVPMLREQGVDTRTAALVLGLGGVGQVLGRLGYARLAAATSVTGRAVVVTGSVAVLTAALAVAPPRTPLVIAVAVALGLARGLYTLVQATAVSDRWGTTAYGRLSALLHAPALVAGAAAPFAGALLAQLTGSWEAAFLVLAVVAGGGAALLPLARPPDAGRRTPSRP